jgi:hypothetical protein
VNFVAPGKGREVFSKEMASGVSGLEKGNDCASKLNECVRTDRGGFG